MIHNTAISTIESFIESNSTVSRPPGHTYQDDFPDAHTQINTLSGIVTEEAVAAAENVINIGVLPALVATGVITNVINIAVFSRQGFADRVNICLFSLALADLGYLVFMMAGKSHSVLSLINPLLGQYWKVRALSTVVGVYLPFMNLSSTLTMIISLDRCVCVLVPLRAKLLVRPRAVATIIACLFIVMLGVYGIFHLKSITIARTDPSNGNQTVAYVTGLSSFYLQNSVVIDAVYILSIIIPTTSLFVVIITTTITTIQLHLSLSWRTKSARQGIRDRREDAVTKMLVAVCCVYVICITPKASVPLAQQYLPELRPSGQYSNLYYVINAVMHVLSVINSSVNFFFYWTLGSKYRATLHTLYWCRSQAETRKIDS